MSAGADEIQVEASLHDGIVKAKLVCGDAVILAAVRADQFAPDMEDLVPQASRLLEDAFNRLAEDVREKMEGQS